MKFARFLVFLGIALFTIGLVGGIWGMAKAFEIAMTGFAALFLAWAVASFLSLEETL